MSSAILFRADDGLLKMVVDTIFEAASSPTSTCTVPPGWSAEIDLRRLRDERLRLKVFHDARIGGRRRIAGTAALGAVGVEHAHPRHVVRKVRRRSPPGSSS